MFIRIFAFGKLSCLWLCSLLQPLQQRAAAAPEGIQGQYPQLLSTDVTLKLLAGSELFFFLTAWCIIVVLPTNISVSCQSHLSAAASTVLLLTVPPYIGNRLPTDAAWPNA